MILTIEEAAEILKLSKITVYKMCVAGELPAFKLRGSWRIMREKLMDHLENLSKPTDE